MVKINIETWKNGKRYIVAREKGRLIQVRKQSGSNIKTKRQAMELFKKNNSFHKDLVRERLTKTTVNYKLKKVNINFQGTEQQFSEELTKWKKSKPIYKPKYSSMYLVQGIYNGKRISATSHKIGTADVRNKDDARNDAWLNFLRLLSKNYNSEMYDAGEGIKQLDKVSNIQEGWVWFN